MYFVGYIEYSDGYCCDMYSDVVIVVEFDNRQDAESFINKRKDTRGCSIPRLIQSYTKESHAERESCE